MFATTGGGDEGLLSFSRTEIARLSGEAAADQLTYLVDHGLPASRRPFFEASAPTLTVDTASGRSFLCVGRAWHGVCEIGIDLSSLDVWALVPLPEARLEITFVNSDIARFATFVNGAWEMAQKLENNNYHQEAAGLQGRLQTLDPPATIDGVWWTGILEEMVELI